VAVGIGKCTSPEMQEVDLYKEKWEIEGEMGIS
jgi:hypothetical protein